MSREGVIGAAVTAIAIVAMAIDHWFGDEPGIDDPAAFFGSAAACLFVAAGLFGRVVPGARTDPDRAAKVGLACGIVALATLPAIFFGFPVVVGGAGIALGLAGTNGPHPTMARVAILLGGLVVVAGAVYAIQGGETPDDD